MNLERWREAEKLFHAALEQAPEVRQDFLDKACGEDRELRRQLEVLLSQDERAGSLFERPLLPDTTLTLADGEPLGGRQFGPYRIIAPLGAGGMGEVYRAYDGKLGREVAIKTLPPEFARDPDRLARFRREARTLASLNHPNIAAIYGLEEAGDADCLVLELVEGEMLRGPLPVNDALRAAKQIAEALQAAHEKGIIHRDLKPANIKVTPDGRAKVLDFGLAKAVWGPGPSQPNESRGPSQQGTVTQWETMAGRVMGTPSYMSPEQARGREVDRRTDIWAFGCVLYELLAGKRAFKGETQTEIIAAVLEREPDWQALPAKTPAKIRDLLRRCLQKNPSQRPGNIAEARTTIEQALGGWNRWRIAAVAATGLALAALAAAVWLRGPKPPPDRSQWVQLTKFPDSVSQPALSRDGRMLAFIRGSETFFGPGQVYVKILPDGDPVQLTHDDIMKMSPAFSPDGARIAYTSVSYNFDWDTSVVPALGGEPQPWLKNASGLSWTGPRQILFSEIKMGNHMGLVTAEESRAKPRDIYLPADEPAMAHRSYLSPDGKWVLLVEMDIDHLWEPCRVMPAYGSSPGRKVGPPGGGCTFGAWSPDNKWIYLTSNAVGDNHIWRQRFPDGPPEQVTSGPTEEEGIAMAPDGRSFVTAMALQNTALWVHDRRGERAITLEGNAAQPRFTPNGEKLLCRIVREAPSQFGFFKDFGELRVVDLRSGRSEPLARGIGVLDYDISPDGRQAVMETADQDGNPRLWLAPLDRSSPPHEIPNVEGGSPRFVAGGDIVFRRPEGTTRAERAIKYLYRVHPDGTGIRKVLERPIAIMGNVSPDGHWFNAWAPHVVEVFPVNGGASIMIGGGEFQWFPGAVAFGASDGKTTYIVPVEPGQILPRIPAGGFHSDEELARLPGARKIDAQPLSPGPSPDIYAFYRGTTQRNLYRIPIP
jgi:serine/threonine protein kinase